MGVREGEEDKEDDCLQHTTESPQMDQHCVPDSWLVVDDSAVDPVNPDILDITPLGSEV